MLISVVPDELHTGPFSNVPGLLFPLASCAMVPDPSFIFQNPIKPDADE